MTRWPDHPMTRSFSVDRVYQIRALAGQRPHHFFYQFAGLVFLPLRQNHGMAYLQAVLAGGSREFGPSVEGGHIGPVQRLRHLVRINPAGLFDGVLQHQTRCITTGRLVAGFSLVPGLVILDELRDRWAKLWFGYYLR